MEVLKKLSFIYEESEENIAKITTQNSRDIFKV
jgi:Tat protein secretion system quality control protein TatD with DNase activity